MKISFDSRKKVLSIFLTLMMTFSLFATTMFAAVGDSSNPTVAGTVTLYFGDPAYTPVPPESLMEFETTAESANSYTYSAEYTGADFANFYPDELLLVIESTNSGDTLSISNVTVSNVAYTQPSGTTGVYDLHIGNATTPSISFTAAAGGTSQSITINFHTPKDIHAGGSNLYAYLPAPGQYTNEGITTGGWGDAFDSSGTLKLGGNPTGTGISLGAFGGYAVFDFGSDGISNNASNKYGADFIVYGNAFWGNSEAGGLQVSDDGLNWYDIAGSRYYDASTIRDYSITYTIPAANAAQNTGTTIPVSPSTRVDVPYTFSSGSGSGSGTVTTNSYHNHSWYPFNANYFITRNGISDLTKNAILPFVNYTYNSGTGNSTLNFTGVINPTITSPTPTPVPTDTNQYQFGYADVHPNQSANFTTPYNPYIYNATSAAYNTTVSGTGGGDPIDISWAVNADGSPKALESIRYVRIYTAEMYVSSSLGEISTEVLGVKKVDVTGSGTTAAPTITVGGTTVPITGNLATISVHTTTPGSKAIVVTPASNTATTYINSQNTTTSSVTVTPTNTNLVRVIVQDGTASPFIVLLKITQ
jgi:hypothetical protein